MLTGDFGASGLFSEALGGRPNTNSLCSLETGLLTAGLADGFCGRIGFTVRFGGSDVDAGPAAFFGFGCSATGDFEDGDNEVGVIRPAGDAAAGVRDDGDEADDGDDPPDEDFLKPVIETLIKSRTWRSCGIVITYCFDRPSLYSTSAEYRSSGRLAGRIAGAGGVIVMAFFVGLSETKGRYINGNEARKLLTFRDFNRARRFGLSVHAMSPKAVDPTMEIVSFALKREVECPMVEGRK